MRMREAATFLGLGIVGWAAVTVAVVATSVVVVVVSRPVANYQAETQREVYQNSLAYQEGAQSDMARFCYDMRTNPDHKQALAAMLREKARVYNGPMTRDLSACLTEAGVP